MRLEKPVAVPRAEKSTDSSSKRKQEDVDDDGDVNMDMYPTFTNDEASTKYVGSVFYLGAKEKSTARRPTRRHRWRGEETGEGEIQ